MPTLESLPPELLFSILAFLSPFNPSPPRYSLYLLAATSKHLKRVVEEYARGLLKLHANIAPKPTPGVIYRKKWRKWLDETCQDCKRPSKRGAILTPGMTLCKGCDAKIPKMTMTTATTVHGLSKLDLFTPNTLHPTLPRLRTGTYSLLGGTVVMVHESDALERKAEILEKLQTHSGKAIDAGVMRRRAAAHNRIIEALDIAYGHITHTWYSIPEQAKTEAQKHVRKAWQTKEGRMQYAKKELQKEWRSMGVMGGSEEEAIELI